MLYEKVITMRVWRRSLPIEAGMEFYSQKGMSTIVEKLFGMQNTSIHPIVRELRLKVVQSSN